MNRDAPSFYTYQPPARLGPVLVNVPHAGEAIPPEIAPTIALDAAILRRDVDLAVDRLCVDAPRLGAGLLRTSISRFVVDLNRHPDDVAAAVEEPPTSVPAVSYGRRGLIWMETTQGEIVVPRLLTPNELAERRRYYAPYHRALAAELAERRNRFGLAVLIDAHSMPSRGASGHPDSGSERLDMVLGDNLGKSCASRLVETVETVLAGAGFSVARNQPYKGGYNTRHYGRPARRVHALQIEINRRLYLDEATTTLDEDGMERVRRAMRGVIEAVVALAPSL